VCPINVVENEYCFVHSNVIFM